MRTTAEPNKYVSTLERYREEPWAENLLRLLRVDAEKILLKHGIDQPPSQSHRARECVAKIQELRCVAHIKHRTSKKPRRGIPKEWCELSRDLRTLKDFLAVHRTVYILEGRPL